MSQTPRYPQLFVEVPDDDADEASAFLFELGAEGVEQRDASTLTAGANAGRATLVASFPERAMAEEAAAAVDPAWSPKLSELVGDAWRDEWKKYFVPFRLTDRVTIRPPWHAYDPVSASELVLELEPGRAFGTGLHPTTALVARAIEALAPRLSGGGRDEADRSAMLDVGTGSGILALVALLLGTARARAVDIDPDAAALTLENAHRNGLEERIVADTTPIEKVEGTFELVTANIEASVLVTMARDLVDRVKPGGTLILSGILEERAEEVRKAFLAEGALFESAPRQGEWAALVFKAKPPG